MRIKKLKLKNKNKKKKKIVRGKGANCTSCNTLSIAPDVNPCTRHCIVCPQATTLHMSTS